MVDVKSHIGEIAAGAIGFTGGALVGGVTGYALGKSSSRKKRKSKRKTSRKRNSKTRRKRYSPYTAGKGKDRSTKRIRFTKTGQPYVIMSSGKARFIKKSSARNSRKRKGGRY